MHIPLWAIASALWVRLVVDFIDSWLQRRQLRTHIEATQRTSKLLDEALAERNRSASYVSALSIGQS